MSKNNNVNPGQYKVAGRLRPDEENREQDKMRASVAEHELREKAREENKDNKEDAKK